MAALGPKGRTLLNALDDFLSRGDDEAKALWDILGAVRGPDISDTTGSVKRKTTAIIRSVAFPQCATRKAFGVMYEPRGLVRLNEARGSSHFQGHMQSAATALGLSMETRSDAEIKFVMGIPSWR